MTTLSAAATQFRHEDRVPVRTTEQHMRVCFDHEVFAMQNVGGISRVFCEIARHLRLLNVDVRVLAGVHCNEYVRSLDCTIGFFRGRSSRGEGLRSLANEVIQYTVCSVWRPHVVHRTYYERTYWDRRFPTVITVQDMIYERLAGLEHPLARMKRRCCDLADLILVPSRATADDLQEVYGISPSKIRVVPYGTSRLPVSSEGRRPLEESYILYVGRRSWYKNFDTLLVAFSRSPLLRTEFRLLCFGGEAVTDEEARRLRELGLEDRVVFLRGDDKVLAASYKHAHMTVIPSRYEGFGLPVLEAMACGSPVACSNTTSLPEVGGDAVVYFDPASEASIRTTLESVAFDTEKLQMLVERGRRRCEQFSWDKCARETLAVYKEISRPNRSYI